MSEGVEFALELNAKLDEAAGFIRELTKVQAAALRAGKGLNEAEKKAGFLTRAMKSATSAAGTFARETLAHFAALASFEGLKRLGEGLFDLGREAFTAAGEAERTRNSFRLLMGVPVADELLDYLDDLAKHTEFTDGALKGFAGELSSAGLAGMALKKGLAAVIDIAALTGNKVEGAANAVALLSKMTLKGEVSTRELLGAKIDPKTFFAQVAKDTGIGVKQVEKAISENKISGEVLRGALFETIQKKTGKLLGGAGVMMSATALAQAEKVKDIIPNLMEELEKSGGLKGITVGMSKLVAAFDPNSPAGKAMVKGLTEMFDKIGSGIAKIDFDKLSNTLITLFTKLPGLIEGTTKAGLAFLDFLAKLAGTTDPTSAKGVAAAAAVRTDKESHPTAAGVTGWIMDKIAGPRKFTQGALPPPSWATGPQAVLPSWAQPKGLLPPLGGEDALMSRVPPTGGVVLPPPPAPATPVRPGAGPGASLLIAKPNQTFAANVTVHVSGAGGDETDRAALGDEVAASARRQMEALFERMAAEGAAT